MVRLDMLSKNKFDLPTWDEMFFKAIDIMTTSPILPISSSIIITELEIAFRMCQVWKGVESPSFQSIHSMIIQVSLNMSPRRPITPLSNMKRLKSTMLDLNFHFECGKVTAPVHRCDAVAQRL